MKMTQLSVSSAILAAVLSGCSQQQVGGSQVSSGGSQYSGGSQVSSSKMAGGSQMSGGSQMAGGAQQVGGSQTQVESAMPLIASQQQIETAKPVSVPVKNVYRAKPQKVKRVYRKKPRPTRSVRRSGNGLPAAQPGQCFAKVKLPATYKTQSRRILIQKASAQRVFVRAPQYRWLNKKVLVRKAAYRNRVIPAQYKTVVNRVLVKPAYNTWRKGHGAITRIDNMTGEIMCRVKIPAVYKHVKKRVLVRQGKTLRTLIPAVYKTVKYKQRVSPALFKTVRRPARYKTQNYRVKTGGARYVWRAVVCKTKTSKHRAKRVQKKSRKYHKVASNQIHRVAPKQYRKAVVMHKPVARKTNYKKQYNKSGIDYQDYLKVMSATGGTKVAKSYKKSKKVKYKKSRKVNRKVSYKKTVNVKKKRVQAKQKTKTKAQTRKGIVYGIQKALDAKGFDPGAMNGKMDAGTAAALKAFQVSRGLPIGKLSKDTFRALGMIR